MSLKTFCWIFSGIIAAVSGWFMVHGFVSAYGWNDPVAGVFFLAIIVWIIAFGLLRWSMSLCLSFLVFDFGIFLYVLKKNEFQFVGEFYPDKNLYAKFKLTDLFQKYVWMPIRIVGDYSFEIVLYHGEKVTISIKDFGVIFNFSCFKDKARERIALNLLKKYGWGFLAQKSVKEKIDQALINTFSKEDSVAKTVSNFESLDNYFLNNCDKELVDEMYSYDSGKYKAKIIIESNN
jgi:hypothetical protein